MSSHSGALLSVLPVDRLCHGGLVIGASLVLVKILSTEDKVRRAYKRLGWLAAKLSVSQEYYLFQMWDL